MRIAIAASGRFHVLDLARELHALGHEVVFYSYVPRVGASRFGLPPERHRNLLPFTAPMVGLQRWAKDGDPKERIDSLLIRLLDRLVARKIEPCDVFIGMSGIYLEAGMAARKKYNAVIILERGSRHILSQKQILEGIPGWPAGKPGVPEYLVKRDLAGYETADYISVPSHHAKQSFLERGYPHSKLFRNHYGVDLTMFPPTQSPMGRPPTILHVGGWSYRKGCDVLVEAWRRLHGVRLLHVGGLVDCPMPEANGRFTHNGPVPQWTLEKFYSEADLFVLASREEGLALVLLQALACGLPVVCTDRTGGEDLRKMIPDKEMVTVVPHGSVDALADGIRKGLAKAARMSGIRDGLGAARNRFSWRAYGVRYQEFLNRIVCRV